MKVWSKIQSKIQDWKTAAAICKDWQKQGLEMVFTNGCFDILHYGHVHYLAEARSLGDRLVIGLNSESSVRRLKGKHRPINDYLTRTHLLAALACVDLVVVFEQDTPLDLIQLLRPDILVKGGDWRVEQIVGSDWVMERGGIVKSLPYVAGYSTSNIEQKIKRQ
ncbi:MAG: D-glycero-beta-D-manno-heptose 1-phosphate adenylyltransferase [Bacteroidota bacterium]